MIAGANCLNIGNQEGNWARSRTMANRFHCSAVPVDHQRVIGRFDHKSLRDLFLGHEFWLNPKYFYVNGSIRQRSQRSGATGGTFKGESCPHPNHLQLSNSKDPLVRKFQCKEDRSLSLDDLQAFYIEDPLDVPRIHTVYYIDRESKAMNHRSA